ncbi:MAG TPA: hypothetical protein VM144_01060 [Aestuariivirga sp.]|nr:hypothetical protein [Aestuariivirga sp.]
MRYQLVEITADGLVTRNAETAKQALSMWYGLDGEVQAIRKSQQEISLEELRAAASEEMP